MDAGCRIPDSGCRIPDTGSESLFFPIYTTSLLIGSIWIHNTAIFLSLLSRGPNDCQVLPLSTDFNTPSEVPKKILLESEKSKISSAIKTDFILSLEIVIIALGTVIEKQHPLLTQILSVSFVAIIATVGVYGIVALIVRMDDAGFFLMKKSGNKGFFSGLGQVLIKALPIVIKILGVVGTIALLLVSGEIFLHNIDYIHHLLPENIFSKFGLGIVFGLAAVLVMLVFKKIVNLVKPAKK